MVEPVLDLDWTKPYPHLAAAPLVEAVIHWQARAERSWNSDELRAALATRLPEYPKTEVQHAVLLALEASLGGESTASQRIGWQGIRLTSADGLNIAQFRVDGLAVSRLRPYESWEVFEAEGRRLWRVFVELAGPSEIQRLGVRFINRIPVDAIDKLPEYLREPPTCPLPLKTFLYQSTFEVPKHDLGVKVIKTLQSPGPEAHPEHALILDTDVFTLQTMPGEEERLNELLPKMRWLKNAVFFNLLTEASIASFQKK